MTDYRTPQAEVHPGDLAPCPQYGCYHAYCARCSADADPLTTTGKPTRDYHRARRWLRVMGWWEHNWTWYCPDHRPAYGAGAGTLAAVQRAFGEGT
jgi:hypothetical protein